MSVLLPINVGGNAHDQCSWFFPDTYDEFWSRGDFTVEGATYTLSEIVITPTPYLNKGLSLLNRTTRLLKYGNKTD
ncbi:MAG TPA: hypothetical protein VE931_10675 [Pyrinomonadaceae bacterium]|nr:hypothetical protein [Pyrinomonadaceae bacterium]